MSSNQLLDTGARAIAKLVAKTKTLTSLDLTYNQIGDSGAEDMALAMNRNKSLRVLAMEWNEIKRVHLTMILAASLRCTWLFPFWGGGGNQGSNRYSYRYWQITCSE